MTHLPTSIALLVPLLAGACATEHASQPEPGPREPRAEIRPSSLSFAEDLFDGRTLNGWVTKGGRYDGAARWSVEDGALTGRQGPGKTGGLIYTAEEYDDFEFEALVKIDYPFDSGVFVRMVPDRKGAQVTLDHRPGGEIGGVYSDGWLQHCPEGAERIRRGEWNHVRVRCEGEAFVLQTWLNGEPLSTYAHPFGTEPYARKGRIGLQVHGGEDVPDETKVQFKDIRVRSIPTPARPWQLDESTGLLRLTEHGQTLGWRPLFDGRSLEGWKITGTAEGWSVDDGVLSASGDGHGQLETTRDFTDFQLRLDFKIGPLTNSGVFLRAAHDGSDPAYSGCEIQILDDLNWERASGSQLKPYQFSGSLYGAMPAGGVEATGASGHLRLAPEWNTYEITYVGSRIRVVLNGVELYDVDTTTLAYAEPPFAERAAAGFIGFQRHGSASAESEASLAFRNVFVREL